MPDDDTRPVTGAVVLAQRAGRATGSDSWVVSPPAAASWLLTIEGDERREGVRESLLAIADGCFGTRGSRSEDGVRSVPMVLVGGIYETRDGQERLLEGPVWVGLEGIADGATGTERRVLDLRHGLVRRELDIDGDTYAMVRFVSLATPGLAVLRAEGPAGRLQPGPALAGPPGSPPARPEPIEVGVGLTVTSDLGGAVTAAARQRVEEHDGRARVERITAYVAASDHVPGAAAAQEVLDAASDHGFDRLLAEHRETWARRWAVADITIDGDPEIQLAVRFALFHLMASVASDGEAAVGPRGLSGRTYSGHVFWDADVYVLPFLAATHPPAARAMLDYRIARIGAAAQEAAQHGYAGAQFPWESASTGREVTPRFARGPDGTIVPIRTGDREEHITADIAWAAIRYQTWTGDPTFMGAGGRRLVTEAARFWASRIRHDGRDAHLYSVIGPDEYHEVVDDNAYTNVMARWNLRAAAALERHHGGHRGDAHEWESLAGQLVDGYDAETGIYEQFAGFRDLEPLLIGEIATPPVAADLLLGRERVLAAQVIKQPDVLMLHHLVPAELAEGSLTPNLDYYLPRTAHGSSLSPAICASLLARAGRPDEALHLFRIACRVDLDDLTGTTAGGLHLATMGGVWQALVNGFAGVGAGEGALTIDPHLPTRWSRLEVRLRYRGTAVRIAIGHRAIETATDGAVAVVLSGRRHHLGPGSARFVRDQGRWERRTS